MSLSDVWHAFVMETTEEKVTVRGESDYFVTFRSTTNFLGTCINFLIVRLLGRRLGSFLYISDKMDEYTSFQGKFYEYPIVRKESVDLSTLWRIKVAIEFHKKQA